MKEDEIGFFGKVLSYRRPGMHRELMRESVDQWVLSSRGVIQEDWDDLASRFLRMRGVSQATFGRLMGELARENTFWHMTDTNLPTIETVIGDAIEIFKDEEKRAEIEATLDLNELPVDSLEEAEALLNEVDLDAIFSTSRKQEQKSAMRKLNYPTVMGFQGYWGGFHSAFNMHIKVYPGSLESSDLDILDLHVKEVEEEISKWFLLLYSGYVQADQELVRTTSLEILMWLEGNLDLLARLCAVVCKSLEKSLEKGKVSPRKLGISALQAGYVARRWALLSIVVLYSMGISILPSDSPEVKDRFADAKELAFVSLIRDGKNVTVGELVSEPDEYEERFVEVEGFVRNMNTRRTEDGKLLSRFELVAPSGIEFIPVVAVFEHLKHIGIVEGCYVRVNGDWKIETPLADEATLQVTRLQLEELSHKSWYDSMLANVKPWFEFYPNSHLLYWSLGSENKEEQGQESPNTGASEIVFKKKFGVIGDI